MKNILILIIILFLSACHNKSNKENIDFSTIEKKSNLSKNPDEKTQIDKEEYVFLDAKIKNTNPKKIICIDPGHGITLEKKMEKLSPKSDILKSAYVSGTKGPNLTEEQLNLAIGKKLRDLLEKEGFEVFLTREVSEITLSNIERAEFANTKGASISVHIHADWSANSLFHGISVLIPSGNLLKNPDIEERSEILGQTILDSVIQNTGAKNNGLSPRNDLTGLNWSDIPSIFIETGFMSNLYENSLLESDEYQNKIAKGISQGIIQFLKNK